MARHLGHACGTWQQAQRDFGHAELNFVVVHSNAVMADQGHLPSATQGRAVQAAHHRFTQTFDDKKILFDLLDARKHVLRIAGLQAHRGLQVSPGEEGGFIGRENDAVDRVFVCQYLGSQRRHVLAPLCAHGVDWGVGLVKRDGGDAVVKLVLNSFHGVSLL